MVTSMVVGGSNWLGRFIAERLAARGDDVIITSRDSSRALQVAAEIDPTTRGYAVDLAQPATIATALADIDEIDNLVLTAVAQTPINLLRFDITAAITAITIKLVGYTEVLHPGVVGDSPRWRDAADHPAVGRTPTRRLVTIDDVADATEFRLRNPGVNGHDLALEAA